MQKRTFFGSLLLGTVLIACTRIGDRGESSALPPRSVWNAVGEGPKIHEVLIAIDGARWQDIFRGTDAALAETAVIPTSERMAAEELTPNIHALMRNGVALGDDDEPFVASGPNFVSLPGYMEMMSGHASPCQENDCKDSPRYTIADAFRDAGAKREEVAVFSSWEPIGVAATHDPSSIVLSNGRTAGSASALLGNDPVFGPLLARGQGVGPAPGHDSYRPDAYTTDLALAYFSERRPRFEFIGLGDTDEYGHRGDYRGYLDALRASDRVVGEVVRISREWQSIGDQVVIVVTSDHGRETTFKEHGRDHPESARTWLVAAGDGVGQGPLAGQRRLMDLAPTLERLAGINAGPGGDVTGLVMFEVLADPHASGARLASLRP